MLEGILASALTRIIERAEGGKELTAREQRIYQAWVAYNNQEERVDGKG